MTSHICSDASKIKADFYEEKTPVFKGSFILFRSTLSIISARYSNIPINGTVSLLQEAFSLDASLPYEDDDYLVMGIEFYLRIFPFNKDALQDVPYSGVLLYV